MTNLPGIRGENIKQWTAHPILNMTWRIIVVLAGDFIGAISVNNFLVPAHILAGGLTGISQLIHHFFIGLPIGTMYFLFNIPLIVLGYKYLGKRFVFLTLIAILGFSAFTDVVHIHFHSVSDPLLISLYGGVLGGVSSGIVIRVGGSMGGTDVLSLVINRLFGKGVGSTGFFMNLIVLLLSITIFGVPAGMYTLVSMFAASRVVNALMHFQQRKTALIVTTKAADMSRTLNQRLTRGSTLMNASGTYTNAQLGVLMCVMTHLEINELKQIAKEVDNGAFISILDTTEVIGRFRHTTP